MKTTVRFKEIQITDGVSKAGKDWQKAMVVTHTINKEPKLIVFSTMKPELITSLKELSWKMELFLCVTLCWALWSSLWLKNSLNTKGTKVFTKVHEEFSHSLNAWRF